MKLKSRTLVSKENEKDPEPTDIIDKEDAPKRLRRPKRIIEDDSSSNSSDSDAEDNIPLNKRKVNQKAIAQGVIPTKKLKLTNHDQFDSPRKVFDLGQRTKYGHAALQKNSFSSSLTKQIKEPRIVIKTSQHDASKVEQDQNKIDTKSRTPSSVPVSRSTVSKESIVQEARSEESKAPQAPNTFKVPASLSAFKAPVCSNTFKAPLSPAKSNNAFKAPLAMNTSPDSFEAPSPPSSSPEFKVPMGPPAFSSPSLGVPALTEQQQSECKYILLQPNHYIYIY
jgi:hypothetical protein